MLDTIFQSILSETFNAGEFLICMAVSIALGAIIALTYMYKNHYSRSFIVTLALLPAMVQAVITLVNGNLGAGIAVMGAFGLVRFRSVPGTAREIGSIFQAMTVGLATGMGYIAVAILFSLITVLINLFYTKIGFGNVGSKERELKITIPETLNYNTVFDTIFEEYTKQAKLIRVKTTNMGSLFLLTYRITLKNTATEKDFLDAIRCKNGNLEIVFGIIPEDRDEL